MKAVTRLLAAAAILVLLAACDSAQREWEAARAEDTQAAYQAFLERYPESELAAQAGTRLEVLRELEVWQQAVAADTPSSYEDYLAAYPSGAHAREAQLTIETLREAEAWEQAQALNTSEALETFLSHYPDGAHSDDARAAIDALSTVDVPAALQAQALPQEAPPARAVEPEGEYQVQLGAFQSQESARKEGDRLEAAFGELLGGSVNVEPPEEHGSGSYYRLKTRPMSEEDAREACDALRREQQSCFIVSR